MSKLKLNLLKYEESYLDKYLKSSTTYMTDIKPEKYE